MSRAPLSVVVPTRNRPAFAARCVASLHAELGPDDEIVVVDSASDPPLPPDALAGARLVRSDTPGASLARNLGWRFARHPVVVFVDDDVTVAPGWLEQLAAALADPAVTFATGRVEVPEHQAGAERPVAVKTDLEPAALDATTGGTIGASCNLAVRRAALEQVGGFDERLGPGTWFAAAEDLDLFDRLFAAGHTGRYEPAALAFHDQWRSRRQLVALDWGYGKGMGARLARVARQDRGRARRLAREVLVNGGVRTVVSDLRRGYQFGALTVSARTLATVLGYVVARIRRLA